MAGLPFGKKNDVTAVEGEAMAELPETEPNASRRSRRKKIRRSAKYGVFNPSDLKKGSGIFGFMSTGGGKLTALSVILALVAGYGVYATTASNTKTIQQLVLLNDIPSNTLLVASDVQPVEVPFDTIQDPSLLVSLENLATGKAYTKVALKRNTVLTLGSVGPFSRISSQLPAGTQLVSIVVPPENAAGGSVAAGDIVDIYGSQGESGSSVFTSGLKGILVLDVIVNPTDIAKTAVTNPDTGESTIGSDSPDLKSGLGSVYKLAVSPEQATLIANAVTSGITFYLVLTNGVAGAPTIDVQNTDTLTPVVPSSQETPPAPLASEETLPTGSQNQDSLTDPSAVPTPSVGN